MMIVILKSVSNIVMRASTSLWVQKTILTSCFVLAEEYKGTWGLMRKVRNVDCFC